MFSEAKFTTVEDEITSPSFTNHIKQMVNSFRSQNLHSRGNRTGSSRAETEKTLRDRVHKEGSVYLGELYIGKKTVRIWVQELRPGLHGEWNKGNKRTGSYLVVSVDAIITNPQLAVSSIIHEIIHGMQAYKTFSDKYNKATTKTSNETEMDWFDYFTEPAELEAQFAELAHHIVQAFYRKSDKNKVLEIVNEVLKKPKTSFADGSWYSTNIDRAYFRDLFGYKVDFLQSISKVPEEVKDKQQYQNLSDKCYRQFKQKLFNLYQGLKSKI
jgi:hypothetical protein